MDKKIVKDLLKNTEAVAKGIINNRDKQLEFIKEGNDYLQIKTQGRAIDNYWRSLILAFDLIGDYFNSKYLKLPISSLLILIGVFIYLLYPTNIIPFKNRFYGMFERMFVVILALELVKGDLSNYSDWKALN